MNYIVVNKQSDGKRFVLSSERLGYYFGREYFKRHHIRQQVMYKIPSTYLDAIFVVMNRKVWDFEKRLYSVHSALYGNGEVDKANKRTHVRWRSAHEPVL
jgi:hypothetical protein